MSRFFPNAAFPHDSAAQIPTYADQPALKPSVYGWLVASYMVIAGIAGSCQVFATLMDLTQPPDTSGLVLAGRMIAVIGAIVGGILLIIELHTPQRFYNMLRIFRSTSPMSIGAYLLISFGFFSIVVLAAQIFGTAIVASLAGALASLAGLGIASNPAALLAATSTPLWAAAPRSLAVRFAASSMASGAALLCLLALWSLGQLRMAQYFAGVAAAALFVEFVASLIMQIIYRHEMVDGPLRRSYGPAHGIGAQMLGSALPIALVLSHFFISGAEWLLISAAVLALASSLIMRGTIILSGNESAKNPLDYFYFARAERDARQP